MKPNQVKQDGFIMVVVLVLMLFFAVVAQRFSKQLLVSTAFAKVATRKEQAKLLALSGVGICLAKFYKAETVTEQSEAEQPESKIGKVYKEILPKHHLWQEYELSKKTDELSGKIMFALSSEDGKINLNKIYDKEKKAVKDDYKKIFDKFVVTKGGDDEEGKSLTEFLAEFFELRRGREVEDPSQLELGDWFKVFYKPPALPGQKPELEAADKKIPVSDLFTVFGSSDGINPALISTTLRSVLGFSRPSYDDEENKKDELEKIYTKISDSWAQDWKANFKSLEALFDKKEADQDDDSDLFFRDKAGDSEGDKDKKLKKGLEGIEKMLSKEIEPKFFTVLSCGEFERVKQTVLAVVERQPTNEREKQKWSDRQNFLVPPGYKIVRIYYGVDTL